MIARRQLLGLGMSAQSIQHQIERGRLHRVERGIYAVGRRELTQRGRWMAAVLACGPTAVLSHASAAALWGIAAVPSGPVEVSIASPSLRRRAGILVYRRPKLSPSDLAVRDGVPVTGIVLTFIDFAWRFSRGRVERAVNEADRLDLIDPETLFCALDRHPGKRGVGRLREILDRRTFRMTNSELERRFLPIADALGVDRPETKRWVNGFEVDFYWPALGLVIETDGLRYHRTPAQQARDRLRDQKHTAAGLTPLRFTHEQIRYEPAHVRETLAAVVRRLAAPGRA